MPRRRRSSSLALAGDESPKKRRRRRAHVQQADNPPDPLPKLLAGILLVGTLGAVTIVTVQHFRKRRALPPPPEGLTAPMPPATGAVGELCENNSRYPGF